MARPSYYQRPHREKLYGVSEIADRVSEALPGDEEVPASTVTAWHRRHRRDFPQPDADLRGGPVWFASTIEPWIEGYLSERGLHRRPEETASLVRELAMRVFRLTALLLEEPVRRPGLIALAAGELVEMRARVQAAAARAESTQLLRGLKRVGDALDVVQDALDATPRQIELGSRVPGPLPERTELAWDQARAALADASVGLTELLREREQRPDPSWGSQASAARVDRDRLRKVCERIPAGRWITSGDITRAIGLPAAAQSVVAGVIATDDSIPNAHRVLGSGGRISGVWVALEGGPEVARARLSAEGVVFGADDAASPSQRWSAADAEAALAE